MVLPKPRYSGFINTPLVLLQPRVTVVSPVYTNCVDRRYATAFQINFSVVRWEDTERSCLRRKDALINIEIAFWLGQRRSATLLGQQGFEAMPNP